VSPPRLLVSVPDGQLRDALDPLPANVEFMEWDMTSPAPIDAIDIVVPPYLKTLEVLHRLADVRTRLVQSQSIGYDGVAELLPPGVTFANAASVHETSAAELALALILASQRGIPDFVRAAEQGRWAPSWHESLADRTVLLVGYGGVGEAVEERLRPFEVNVVRVARTERTDERGTVYATSALSQLLPVADVVVVSVPLNEETTRLVDDVFLSAMRDGALLVNVARGGVADTSALLRHASSQRIRLALDVTEPEPLPEGHPLFALSNVLITPHVGGATSAMLPRMARLLNEQITRMARGDEPRNVVIRT
jgi:phosphoglycerate dehydrogenase-like enzyme